MKKIKITCILLIFLLIILSGCQTAEQAVTFGTLEIYIFEIDKADAILIKTENHAVLIDTGEREHGQMIVDELINQGVAEIDALIVTHFHKDHVGGAATVIKSLPVKDIFVPNYGKESKHYERFIEEIDAQGLQKNSLTDSVSFSFDNSDFIIYPSKLPYYNYNNSEDDDGDSGDESIEIPNENNFSLVVSISHGNHHFLFTGDAKSSRMKELLSMDEIIGHQYDFLKVPHHGRHSGRSLEFIDTIKPSYAVITCSDDFPADERVVEALKRVGAEVYFTSDGYVHCLSDGASFIINVDRREREN